MHFDYTPRGVCSRAIHIDLTEDGSTIEQVSFEGGCNGNLKAVSKLVAGHPVDEIVGILAVIMSGFMVVMYIIPNTGATLVSQEWAIIVAWVVLAVVFAIYSKHKYGDCFGKEVDPAEYNCARSQDE